jgi:enoyl-CoA hydratase
LNRPERLNAVSADLDREILAGLDAAASDPAARVVVLTGAGRAFCAGADLKAHEAGERTSAQLVEYVHLGQQVCHRIQTMELPVIAAVNGYALGAGAEIATSADLLVMSDDAHIGFPESSVGTYVGGGVTYRLPRLIGLRRAHELLTLGTWLTGEQAERIGLASRCVSADELTDTVQGLALEVASKAPISLARLKAAFSDTAALDLALTREEADLLSIMRTADWAEGVASFVDRRTPVFLGR